MKRYKFSIFKTFICFSIMLMALGTIKTSAATKTSTFDIKSSYTAIAFTIEFDEEGEYTGYLTDPAGTVYDMIVTDSKTLFVNIKSPAIGIWSYTVDSIGELPKLKVSYKPSSLQGTYDAGSSIKVGKDIADLTKYFVNDFLVLDWSSCDVGSVIIKVVNLESNTVLANEKVEGTSFTVKIPSSVKTIYIEAVPASSANIDGAQTRYTIDVPSEPNASVEFKDIDYCNSESTIASVTLNEEYSVFATCNDVKLCELDATTGTHDIEIPIGTEGENTVRVYIVDRLGNQHYYSNTFIRDTRPPKITLNAEYDNAIVNAATFPIGGKVTDYSQIFVNEEQVFPATDGQFGYECRLHAGENEILIKAVDAAGNESVSTFKINYSTGAVNSSIMMISRIISLALFAILAAIVYLVYKKIKKNKIGYIDTSGKNLSLRKRDDEPSIEDDSYIPNKGNFEESQQVSEAPVSEQTTESSKHDTPEQGATEEPQVSKPPLFKKSSIASFLKRKSEPCAVITEEAHETVVELESAIPMSESEDEADTEKISTITGSDDTPLNTSSDATTAETTPSQSDGKIFRRITEIEDPEEKKDTYKKVKEDRRNKATAVRPVDNDVEAEIAKLQISDKSAKGSAKKFDFGLLKVIIVDLLIILAIYLLLTYVFEFGYVNSGSMEPTIMTNDFYFATRVPIKDPELITRGDIIVFDVGDASVDGYVKRVIGIENDVITFANGYVYVNGRKVDESQYLSEDVPTYGEGEYTVPEDCFFVMGDNRPYSTDSRMWAEPYIKQSDVRCVVNKTISTHGIVKFFQNTAAGIYDFTQKFKD